MTAIDKLTKLKDGAESAEYYDPIKEEILVDVCKVTLKLNVVNKFDEVNEEIQDFLDRLRKRNLLVEVEYLYLKKTKEYVNIAKFVKEVGEDVP